ELEEYRQVFAVKNINGSYYSITVTKSKIESEDLLATLALVTVMAMLLLTGTLIFVNRRVARSVWLPFYKNLQIIEQFSANEKKPVILEETGITEFDKLKSVLTGLTKHIISDFQNQKQFSEDVSHELQTPLAIISSRLEILLNDSELSQHHAEVLQSIYSSVRRLSKLNKELILLSKIENNQFSGNETINLKILAVEKLDEFNELIRLKNLNVETSLDDDFIIETNPVLAGILVNNLLSNSINHTPEGGKIKIKTSAGKLSFCNSGNSEIPEPEKLFDRFYKVDPSSGSVGLGLAIVKKICDIQNLSVQYIYTKSLHCFDLKF
ncbi:MAG: HAMP domain-containing sensor histidine kinase, partial [Bacteroidota bacterium]